MLIHLVQYKRHSIKLCCNGCHNHNQKKKKPGFFRFPSNDSELRQKCINACKKKKKRTEWNPSGKNVNICGDHFLTGTSSPQNSRIFLEWKFLSFDESSYKLKNLRMIDIDSFSLKLLHLWYLINLVRERVAWISGNKICPTVKTCGSLTAY